MFSVEKKKKRDISLRIIYDFKSENLWQSISKALIVMNIFLKTSYISTFIAVWDRKITGYTSDFLGHSLAQLWLLLTIRFLHNSWAWYDSKESPRFINNWQLAFIRLVLDTKGAHNDQPWSVVCEFMSKWKDVSKYIEFSNLDTAFHF